MHTVLKVSLGAIATLLLSFALTNATSDAGGAGGAMAVDCEGNSTAIEADCEFGATQNFSVAVHLTDAPPGGFTAFQAKFSWDTDVLRYRPRSDIQREAAWLDCAIPVRSPETPSGPPVLYGCVAFPEPAQPFTYEGPGLLFQFSCLRAGTTTIELIDTGDLLDSYYLDDIGNRYENVGLDGATVTCGGPNQPRPDPQIPTRTTGPLTPEPSGGNIDPGTGPNGQPGPGNGPPNGTDETPDPADEATSIATPPNDATPDATRTASSDSDDNGDGGFPAWAWIVIGVAVVGGVGGAGLFAWRRYSAGQGPDGGSAGPPDAGSTA